MNVAGEHGLPMVIFPPTRRSHPDMLVRHGFSNPDDLRRVNVEAIAFVQALRRETGVEDLVFISGFVGPRRDGYDLTGAPDAATAELYHRSQIKVLTDAGVDLFTAGTVSSFEEFGRLPRLCATALPYILAPVLSEAVARIDAATGVHCWLYASHPLRRSCSEPGLARSEARCRAAGQRAQPDA